MSSTVTKIFTVSCGECRKGALLQWAELRQLARTEGPGGTRIFMLRCCRHVGMDETFDIESHAEEMTSPS